MGISTRRSNGDLGLVSHPCSAAFRNHREHTLFLSKSPRYSTKFISEVCWRILIHLGSLCSFYRGRQVSSVVEASPVPVRFYLNRSPWMRSAYRQTPVASTYHLGVPIITLNSVSQKLLLYLFHLNPIHPPLIYLRVLVFSLRNRHWIKTG